MRAVFEVLAAAPKDANAPEPRPKDGVPAIVGEVTDAVGL